MPIENFIRGADNQIKLTLTEDGEAISGAWTGLDIWIGSVQLTRAEDGDGITLDTATGLLTITPANLTTDEKTELDSLSIRIGYRVKIIVTSALNDDGAVFGGDGSEKIIFMMSDKP